MYFPKCLISGLHIQIKVIFHIYCKTTILKEYKNRSKAPFYFITKSYIAGQSMVLTALHRSLSKYLTAKDTCGTSTPTKHNRSLARLYNLLYLKPGSTQNVNRIFSVLCIE